MHGAVYGTLALAVLAVAALIFNPVLALIPILLAAGLVAFLVLGRSVRGRQVAAGPGPSVPSTAEASFDPVQSNVDATHGRAGR
jgi:hypothetical protein